VSRNAPDAQKSNFRIQGTDGIRREVKLSASEELNGLTPQQAFLDRGYITEELMELYAYAHVKNLVQEGKIKSGSDFVVGWDPRDVNGDFNQAVVRGIRKAGGNALVLGIVPTPLIQIFIAHKKSAGGFMVTASHNPSDQNGIKTFLSYRSMKLLPENDVALTESILALNFKNIARQTLKGKKINCRNEALKIFNRFSLASENTWSESISFKNIVLVVDPANGSLTGIAAEAFQKAGFGNVVEVNNKLDGNVNHKSGVGDLEGRSIITSSMIEANSGLFSKHRAIIKLFKLGRKHKSQIQSGKRKVCGAVFDADGDRFYRLDYQPDKDILLVLDGDKTAFLQSELLMSLVPNRNKYAGFINTVESDINCGKAIESLGLNWQLSAVGDKWILLRIALIEIESRLEYNLKLIKNKKHSLSNNKIIDLRNKLKSYKNSQNFNATYLEDIESSLNSLSNLSEAEDARFYREQLIMGSEETGHNITQGKLEGCSSAIFFGNGLKSALNTFSATEYLLKKKSVKKYFSYLERPFKPGLKETYYSYYIVKEKFYKNSSLWKKIKNCVIKNAELKGFSCRTINFQEDPDMLYLAINSKSNKGSHNKTPENGIFIRNSGTENKISVNLRGDKKNKVALKAIGELCIRVIIPALKDRSNRLFKLESSLFNQIAKKPLPENSIKDNAKKRVLSEMLKQGFIKPGAKGYTLTSLGKWYNKILISW
jgi:phosphomannomutase